MPAKESKGKKSAPAPKAPSKKSAPVKKSKAERMLEMMEETSDEE
jgi:hypothetical protein